MKTMVQQWTTVKLSTKSQVVLLISVIGVGILGFLAVSSDFISTKGSQSAPIMLTALKQEKDADKQIDPVINPEIITSYYPYIPGDVNGDDKVIGSDVTYLVNYLRGGSAPVYGVETPEGTFYPAADVNGDCEVSLSDVTHLVNYFLGIAGLEYCPDFPPLSANQAPTQDDPIIIPENPIAADNITCQSQNVSDPDDEAVTSIYNWIKNGSSLAAVNMPFDTNSSGELDAVTDYSGNENHGTFGYHEIYCQPGDNYPAWTSEGKIGGAFNFDGNGLPGWENKCLNDFIEVPIEDDYIEHKFTFTMWVKPDSFQGEFNFLVAKEQKYLLRFNPQYDNCLHGYVYSDESQELEHISSETCVFDESAIGQWYHLAFSYTGANLKLYINGEPDATVDYSLPLGSFSAPMHIGAHNSIVPAYDGTFGFDGTIDDFRFYDSALTDEQIQQIYNDGEAGDAESTVVNQETETGDIWICDVTPNDSWQDGETKSAVVQIE